MSETRAEAVKAWEQGQRPWHCTADHTDVPCQRCTACRLDRSAIDDEFEENR
jgi:hypothetical protein